MVGKEALFRKEKGRRGEDKNFGNSDVGRFGPKVCHEHRLVGRERPEWNHPVLGMGVWDLGIG